MSTQDNQQSGLTKKIIGCGGIATAITAILTLMVGLCSLAVWVYDFMNAASQPPPTPIPSPAYGVLEGDLSEVSLEFNIDLGQYLQIIGESTDQYSKEVLEYPGVLAHYKVRLSGFNTQTCTLNWSIYDANTKTWVLSSTFDLYDTSWDMKNYITAERDVDQITYMIWVVSPGASGSYFVRLELYDPKGGRLDYIDSEVFYVP